MPAQASSCRGVRVRAVRYFGPKHPLAVVAAGWCAAHVEASPVVAGFACGACWERAIRDHERVGRVPGFDPASIPPAPAGSPRHLGPGHPLARVASRLCHAHVPVWAVIAQVACGPCWEAAVRRDEEVVVEYGLARDLHADDGLVDEAAVRLAVAGVPVELTPVEAEAARAAHRALLERTRDEVEVPTFAARILRGCPRRFPRRAA